jgi:MraZ protein
MFRGQFEHAIDDKGRLSIPAKFRQALGKEKSLVLTCWNSYLSAFPLGIWRDVENRIRSNPTFQEPTRDFLRFVYSSAEDAEIDSQGRVLIPQALRLRAGIIKDVVLIGVMDQIEMWDKGRWAAKLATAPPPEELASRLGALGI